MSIGHYIGRRAFGHITVNPVDRKDFKSFMEYTRETAITRLLESYRIHYNVTTFDSHELPLAALCEYYEHSEKYVLSRKATLWTAECEEFLYLFNVGHLTAAEYESCRDFALSDGMKRAHIGPGHMYTYITPIFVCDTCDDAARQALKKCRIYKSFLFSLHGWMDFHTAVLELGNNQLISTNRNGKYAGEIMKRVLFQMKKKRRRFL